MVPFRRTGSEAAALQYHIGLRTVDDDGHQQLLVHINSCYVVRHSTSRDGSEECTENKLRTVSCSEAPGPGTSDTFTDSCAHSGSGLLTRAAQ